MLDHQLEHGTTPAGWAWPGVPFFTACAFEPVYGGCAHELEDGDAVTFDADLPHHFENPGDDDARFYAVVAAGLRRS